MSTKKKTKSKKTQPPLLSKFNNIPDRVVGRTLKKEKVCDVCGQAFKDHDNHKPFFHEPRENYYKIFIRGVE